MNKILIFFFFIFNLSFSQSGEAVYKIYNTFNTDSPILIKNLDYKLVFNSKSSFFEKNEKLTNDSYRSRDKIIERRISFGKYYRFLENNLKLHQIKLFNQTILKKDSLYDQHWILSDKEAIISNLKCNYAFLNLKDERTGYDQKIEAWYSTEISLPYGPNGFDGLPGLIIKLKRDNVIFILDKIEFFKKEKKINEPDGRIMTEDELMDYASDYLGLSKEQLENAFKN